MAVNPALLKAIAKVAVETAADEEKRKKLLIILLIPIISVLLILSMFYYILSEPFAFLSDILGGSRDTPHIEQFREENRYMIPGVENDEEANSYPLEEWGD